MGSYTEASYDAASLKKCASSIAAHVAGTLFGVLMLGIIQTLISFDGSFSAWWSRIAIVALLCVFCLLQTGC